MHRRQITYDWVDRATGEAQRGQITPATRQVLREWLGELPGGDGHFAVEGCTGWRFVAEELQAAGLTAHLAEPADTATLRGRKRRAKTDRADARHLRELLEQDRLPESWIPPAHLLDLRELVRLGKTLIDQRTQWKQRIHAVLFHHGLPTPPGALGTQAGRAWLAGVGLPPPSRLLVDVGVAEIEGADARLEPISGWLRAYARRQPGCRALMRELFGVGSLCAPTILAELGDARRFAGGDAVVGYAGLDITVWSSDTKRSPGHLARQGPEVLRWALFEAAKSSARRTAPDHAYYRQVKDRLAANRATLSTARKLAATPATSWSNWRGGAGAGLRRPAAPRCWLSRCPRRPEVLGVRAVPTAQQMGRGRLPQGSCRHALAWTTQKDRAAAHPGDHPIDHLVAAPRREHPDKAGRPGTHRCPPEPDGGGP